MSKNFWGEPDDIEPFPDWMKPGPRSGSSVRRLDKTLISVIEETLKKPVIFVVFDKPDDIT